MTSSRSLGGGALHGLLPCPEAEAGVELQAAAIYRVACVTMM